MKKPWDRPPGKKRCGCRKTGLLTERRWCNFQSDSGTGQRPFHCPPIGRDWCIEIDVDNPRAAFPPKRRRDRSAAELWNSELRVLNQGSRKPLTPMAFDSRGVFHATCVISPHRSADPRLFFPLLHNALFRTLNDSLLSDSQNGYVQNPPVRFLSVAKEVSVRFGNRLCCVAPHWPSTRAIGRIDREQWFRAQIDAPEDSSPASLQPDAGTVSRRPENIVTGTFPQDFSSTLRCLCMRTSWRAHTMSWISFASTSLFRSHRSVVIN